MHHNMSHIGGYHESSDHSERLMSKSCPVLLSAMEAQFLSNKGSVKIWQWRSWLRIPASDIHMLIGFATILAIHTVAISVSI